MTIYEQEKNSNYLNRHAAEGREANFESKEKKEEAEDKKAAARERVEVVSKEVKNTKQQIQHIMANMQQVIAAVRAIRAQLQLAQDDEDEEIPSVKRDQKRVAGLQVKLMDLNSQLGDLKIALLTEEKARIHEENPDWKIEFVESAARESVEQILEKVGVGDNE